MRKKGFTLIELMIALGVFLIFSMFLYQTFFSQIRKTFNFNGSIDIQYNVSKALHMLTDEIRSSPGITLVNSSNGTVSQVQSNGRVIIDLKANSSSDITYNSADGVLSDINGNSCSFISMVEITQGKASDNEGDLIKITVTAAQNNESYTSSTAVNIRR